MNNKQEDDLFSGMALKNNKKSKNTPVQTHPSISVQSKPFELDFLNLLVSNNNSISNSSNNTKEKYNFPNESIFNSLNSISSSERNSQNQEIKSSRNSNPNKNQEYSFLKAKSNVVNSNKSIANFDNNAQDLKKFEESLKKPYQEPKTIFSEEKTSNKFRINTFDVFPGEKVLLFN
jgi:hypothetical protein